LSNHSQATQAAMTRIPRLESDTLVGVQHHSKPLLDSLVLATRLELSLLFAVGSKVVKLGEGLVVESNSFELVKEFPLFWKGVTSLSPFAAFRSLYEFELSCHSH
jgi:hypothetical protein